MNLYGRFDIFAIGNYKSFFAFNFAFAVLIHFETHFNEINGIPLLQPLQNFSKNGESFYRW